MHVLITEEYGYAYHLWNFPGTPDELVAEARSGRAPFFGEMAATMPPTRTRIRPGYKGTLTRDIDLESPASFEEVSMRCAARLEFDDFEEAILHLKDGRTVKDPSMVPSEEDIAKNGLPDSALVCPTEETISQLMNGGLSPWSARWLNLHFRHCPACRGIVESMDP